MDATIGLLTWDACENCKYYRPKKGGCQPLDDNLVELKVDSDFVECEQFQPKEPLGS